MNRRRRRRHDKPHIRWAALPGQYIKVAVLDGHFDRIRVVCRRTFRVKKYPDLCVRVAGKAWFIKPTSMIRGYRNCAWAAVPGEVGAPAFWIQPANPYGPRLFDGLAERAAVPEEVDIPF